MLADILNAPIINTLLTVLAVLLGYWLVGKRTAKQQITQLIDERVSTKEFEQHKESEIAFRKRIGKEIDKHDELLDKIKTGLAYLITKSGGNPRDLGL